MTTTVSVRGQLYFSNVQQQVKGIDVTVSHMGDVTITDAGEGASIDGAKSNFVTASSLLELQWHRSSSTALSLGLSVRLCDKRALSSTKNNKATLETV